MRKRSGPHFKVEIGLLRDGIWPVAGVDEVGRGPLAGPVAAAAVILDPKRLPRGIDDSKALTAKEREAAFNRIMDSAIAVGLAYASAAEIDATDIRKAGLTAMSRAVNALSLAPAHVLVDGRDLPELPCSALAIVRGDAASLSIAAASIVAKVIRDRLMQHVAIHYPGYGFEANVGYFTKQHQGALAKLGPTPFHRMSFAPLRGP
jgi:ribonuclease HII